MGLFDRIRQSDEEVEIRPPERERDVYDGFDRADDDAAEGEDDDGEEEFLLPGMKPASEAESDDGSSRSRDARGSSHGSRRGDRRSNDVSLEKIAEQNERIIELLEEIARTGPGR